MSDTSKSPAVLDATGSWRSAAVSVAVTVAVLSVSTWAAVASGWVLTSLTSIGEPRALAAGEREALVTLQLATFLLVFQLTTVALTVAAIRLSGTPLRDIISMSKPKGGWSMMLWALVALLGFAIVFALAVFLYDRNALVSDVRPFAELIRADTWWLMAIAATIGAPFAEEVLFRGYLYTTLRNSPLGAMAAGVISAALWAAMHVDYTAYGLGAILLIGLYLAWLRERTGSLVAPMLCHAAYNALITFALAAAPEQLLQPV